MRALSNVTKKALEKCGLGPDDIHLMVPHQANLRIIEAVVGRTGIPMDKVMLTVQNYGNMSAATVPVALTEAVETGRVRPGALVLMPAFGAGLTFCAHLMRWGSRVTPLTSSEAALPPSPKTALEMVDEIRARRLSTAERSAGGLHAAV